MRKLGKLTAISLGTLLAGSMAFGLVGCGGGPQEGQTTIRFWYTASISENRIMQNMIDDYNKGQGVEDGVYVDGDNRQNIERTALYVDTPDVLTVTDENFKSWALEGLFTDLSDYYANEPGDYTEEGIPEAYTQTFRIDKEVGENGVRMAGEGADLQGVPFGADPMAYYYSLPAFEDQGINIISVAEEDLDGTGTYAKVQPHGYAKYKESPFEGAVSSTNLAGDTVYKVFNNRIPMNWEEFRYLSKMFTRSSAYNPDSPTTYGSGTHWWFAYAWSVGGDCIGWSGENYDFSVADEGANYLVLSDTLELNGKTYYAGDIVSYEDHAAAADAPAGSVHELPSTYDALYEFVRLSSPVGGNGGRGENGYGIGLFSNDNAAGSLVNGEVALLASSESAITSLETSYRGKYDIAPAQQWREYEGGSVYYDGAETFENEYLKVIGETYDNEVYTGELAVDEATSTPLVGRTSAFAGFTSLVIPARSDASLKDLAWKFIRWAASEEGQRYLMQMSDVPNQTSLAMSDDYYAIGSGKNYWALAFQAQTAEIGDWAYFENGEWVNDWSGSFNGQLRAGYTTIEGFMESDGAAADRAISEVDIYLNGRF